MTHRPRRTSNLKTVTRNNGVVTARAKTVRATGKRMWLAGVALLGIAPLASAQLVINEIDYDQPGSDFSEFIELRNNSGADLNLDSFEVVLIDGAGGSPIYGTFDLPNETIAVGRYYVLCEDAATVPNCDADVLSTVQNGAPDAVAVRENGIIIDTVSYEGDIPGFTESSGANLEDPNSTAFVSIGRFPDGADTDVNNADLSLRCITPGAANGAANTGCGPPPVEGLVINEIDYDQGAIDNAEFIELYNDSTLDIDLSNFALELIDGVTATAYQTIALPATTLTPGSYYVVCASAATVANCDLDVMPDTDLVQDGAPDAVALTSGASVVDVISYEGTVAAPYSEGSGAGLNDAMAAADSGLGRFPDGTDTDSNNADFAVRCITPGTANSPVGVDCAGGTSPFVIPLGNSKAVIINL